jgi:tripartite-type tricarboxylate transporter receptor subunit TctC
MRQRKMKREEQMGSGVRCVVAAAALACALVALARAEDFPSKPLTIMVGLAPGGITDVTARLYAEIVSRNLGQRITIENRPAAAGALAAAAVQNAPPDGYTLLVFSGSQHATVAAMGTAPYDPVNGFSFISVLFNSAVAFVVPPDSPANTLEELFELGRKRPGGLSMGTPGLGSPSHLLGARVALAAKAPPQSIHYRGGAPMLADVLTGRVDFAVVTLSTSRSFLAEKKLRALATDIRWSGLPGVPTLAELGYGNEKVANWFGVAGPVGMPPALVQKLNAEFVKASRDGELVKRLAENGTLIATSTPEEMRGLMIDEVATMDTLVKTLNLRQP